ncbi:MAG: hypothetical protein R3E42_01220 [Burkholderiaceae bacterium]
MDDTPDILVRLFHQLRRPGRQEHHAEASGSTPSPCPTTCPSQRDTTGGASTPKSNKSTATYLGMGEDDINVHDQWACEA